MAYASLIVYVLILFIRPQEWVPGMLSLNIIVWLAGFAVFATLLGMANNKWRFKNAPQNGLVFGFFVAVLVSNLLCFESPLNLHPTLFAFTNFGKIVFFFYLISINLQTVRQVRGLIAVMIIGCLFMAIHGILQIHSEAGSGFGGQLPLNEHGITAHSGFRLFRGPERPGAGAGRGAAVRDQRDSPAGVLRAGAAALPGDRRHPRLRHLPHPVARRLAGAGHHDDVLSAAELPHEEDRRRDGDPVDGRADDAGPRARSLVLDDRAGRIRARPHGRVDRRQPHAEEIASFRRRLRTVHRLLRRQQSGAQFLRALLRGAGPVRLLLLAGAAVRLGEGLCRVGEGCRLRRIPSGASSAAWAGSCSPRSSDTWPRPCS